MARWLLQNADVHPPRQDLLVCDQAVVYTRPQSLNPAPDAAIRRVTGLQRHLRWRFF
jgi:hypothetical protein